METRTGVHIRPLTPDDLDDALALSSGAGWNQRPDDWQMLMRIAAGGAVAAAYASGRVVGTAIGIDYGGFGWIAMMLVDPAHRGMGLGGSLLEAAIAALPPDRTIRLDATPLGRPLYERHGFRDETRLVRYVADAERPAPPSSALANTPVVRALEAKDLDRVRVHDALAFGGSREDVLAWALTTAPDYARVTAGGDASPQYCFGRRGRLFDQIGPVVARNDGAACELVRAAMSSAGGRPLVIDAFERHGADEGFTAWLTSSGFVPQRPLFRMCRPQDGRGSPDAGAREGLREFAILGPEFG